MKKILSVIKKFFTVTFALYTCTSYGMMLLNVATVNGEAPQWSGVALLFSHILLFSAITGLSQAVITAFDKLNGVISHLLRFIIAYGAFYLAFFALGKSTPQPINVVVMSAIFTVIYAAVVGIFALVRAIAHRKENADEEYESIYEKPADAE